ncbi:MAG: uroporphyrinogen decarboxylase/cobalamine-independent methonine synthase family protein [Eubacteriales bacterium]
MELKYKPDLSRAKKYWEAFWQKQIIDRPVVNITAPKKGAASVYHNVYNANVLKARGNPEKLTELLQGYEEFLKAFSFLGEEIPALAMDFGPDMYASFFGADIFPAANNMGTTWIKPMVTDWVKFTGELDLSECGTYKQYLQMYKSATEFSEGKFLIGCPDCHSNLDALSALRGPQDLCYDLMDYPDEIEQAMVQVRAHYRPFWDELYKIGDFKKRGSIGWIPTYCDGRFATVQCDAICLISPEQARRYVIPALIEECEVHDHVSYHYDGKQALVHLDDILQIKKIDIIQWVPGDGAPRSIEWMDLLHKIQAAGKGLWIYDWTLEEIKQHFRELKPEGLCFSVSAPNEDEAESFLEYLVKNT